MEIPKGFKQVTKDQFYQSLSADKRDIMPKHDEPESTSWIVQASRQVWGWSYPGWKNPGATPRLYAIKITN